MSNREPNVRLAALLTEANWSAATLAHQVNTAGAAHGVTLTYNRSTVAHWLGGSRPRHPVPALVASVLSRRCGRLITPQETGLVPTPAHAPLMADRARGPGATARLTDLCRADVDPARRAETARAVFSPTDPHRPTREHPGPAARPKPFVRLDSGRRATSADSRTTREMTQSFADLAARHGGRRVRTWLGLYLAEDAGHLPDASSSNDLRRQLLVDVAQLAHLLADMTADSGHPGLARKYFEASLDLADEAGNDRMHAITLRAMSVQAMRLGHHDHAFELADAAVTRAGSASDHPVMAFLLTQRAHTAAITGRARPARTDLAAAERHHNRSQAAPPGAFTTYTPAALHFRTGQTFRALRDPANALTSLQAARHRTPPSRRATALTEATVAETLADMGHLEAACTHWNLFLDLYPHLASTEVEHARTRMRQTLRRFPRQQHSTPLRRRDRALSALTTAPDPRTPPIPTSEP
ncbi:tol-pal system YbgF family protein [Embleya sp. NPDC127516]|uniref:tetratricopeptide repeat protein n=1 Tax=Embleya sp. NPDC127516 TaxID=3363990 RepID=UPI0038128291